MKLNLPSLDIRHVPFRLMPWIRVLGFQTTYAQARQARDSGAITARQWKWFLLFWTWSTVRWSNLENAGTKQDKCHAAIGYEGMLRRFDRVQRLRSKLWEHHFRAYFKTTNPVST
jgi:hypothetical protein